MVIGVLTKPLREIEEIDLQGLAQGAIPEGLTLEFKRELNLDDSKQKKEAAKDVSALANTVGGRLFYGIDETKLPDGSAVAGGIVPLTDGSVASRLADVLHSAIHPRARFDFQATKDVLLLHQNRGMTVNSFRVKPEKTRSTFELFL